MSPIPAPSRTTAPRAKRARAGMLGWAVVLLTVSSSACTGISRRMDAAGDEGQRTALSWFVEGVAAEGRGAYTDAARCYELSWEKGGQTPTLAIARARCRLYAGEADAAYRLLRSAWRSWPGDGRLLGLLSELSFDLAPPEEAILVTQRCLLADPSRVRPAYHLERLLRQAGRVDEVVAIFESVAGEPGASAYLQRRLETLRRSTGRR